MAKELCTVSMPSSAVEVRKRTMSLGSYFDSTAIVRVGYNDLSEVLLVHMRCFLGRRNLSSCGLLKCPQNFSSKHQP